MRAAGCLGAVDNREDLRIGVRSLLSECGANLFSGDRTGPKYTLASLVLTASSSSDVVSVDSEGVSVAERGSMASEIMVVDARREASHPERVAGAGRILRNEERRKGTHLHRCGKFMSRALDCNGSRSAT